MEQKQREKIEHHGYDDVFLKDCLHLHEKYLELGTGSLHHLIKR